MVDPWGQRGLAEDLGSCDCGQRSSSSMRGAALARRIATRRSGGCPRAFFSMAWGAAILSSTSAAVAELRAAWTSKKLRHTSVRYATSRTGLARAHLPNAV